MDVRLDSDGCGLAGTFTEPATAGAGALLLPGSGRIDRDSDSLLFPLHLTAALADALGAIGVATLRYDKRGVGASDGDYLSTGFDQVRADARVALTWLAQQRPGLPLLVIGHGEGALHAAELGADAGVAGVVLLAMSTRSGEDTLAWQTGLMAARQTGLARVVAKLVGADVLRVQRRHADLVKASDQDVVRIKNAQVNARWLREYFPYRPDDALSRIQVPVLAITGAQDREVPPDGVEAIGESVSGPFEGHVVPGLSHVFRSDPDGVGPRGYGRALRAPVSPELLALVSEWVTRHWGKG